MVDADPILVQEMPAEIRRRRGERVAHVEEAATCSACAPPAEDQRDGAEYDTADIELRVNQADTALLAGRELPVG